MQLREMRTWRALCAASPDADATARLSDRDLRAAALNPDHSEAGRAAVEAEMQARRLSAEPWRIAVPGFIKREDLAKKGARLFFGVGRAWRKWSGWAVFLSLLAIVVLAFAFQGYYDNVTEQTIRCEYHGECDQAPRYVAGMAVAEGHSPSPGMEAEVQPPPISEVDARAVFEGAQPDVTLSLVELVGIIPLVSLIIWFIASALRRKPARILLLRKFNQRAVSEPLERMLAQELRPYGHVASLSDKHIRRDHFGWLSTAALSLSNPVAALWFVIGMPIRFIWRLFDRSAMGPAVVLNARDYRNLALRLRDRVGLNIQVATTSKEAFLVRTSDAWWQMVVRLLMDSSDAIVVDLSQVTAGTAWELDVIRAEQTQARCVFVSIWGKAEEAQAALAARGFDNPCFYYAPDGEMQRRPQFRAAMLAAMRA